MSGEVTTGLNVIAAAVGGSQILNVGNGLIAIGAGSQTMTSGNTSLISENDRNFIETVELNTAKEITFIANWSPTEVSGLILTEHGLTTIGSSFVTINTMNGSVVFNGEQELQIQQTLKFYI